MKADRGLIAWNSWHGLSRRTRPSGCANRIGGIRSFCAFMPSACAGLALWVLGKALHAVSRDTIGFATPGRPMFADVSPNARIAAIFSVVFWLGAIVSGRLIGYTMPPPPP